MATPHLADRSRPYHVAVIGGGISGLSAAWYLRQYAAEADLDLHCTVLERDSRWGGKVLTEQVSGDDGLAFVVEGGPDSFLTQKPWAMQLARELGLGDRLLGTNDAKRKVFVLSGGKPVPLPDGVLLIVPTRFMPFALSPLLSPLGKLRMALDFFIPARKDGGDETLAGFIRRRLGNEALDKLAEPLMTGIYNAEAERQSILATFPRFRTLEREHGSLIRGMLASRRQRRSSPNGHMAESAKGSKPVSVFMTLQGGTQELIDALVAQIDADLRLDSGVQGIEQQDDGTYRLALADGQQVTADAVILAAPAYLAADLLRPFAPGAADLLAGIRYVSTGTISLAYRQQDIPNLLPGSGLVIPHSEQRPINAITLSSIKFNHRAPQDHLLLRVFFGGSRSPESLGLDDAVLLRMVRAELSALLHIDAEPLFQRIYRWHRANPQYDVGHLDRVAAIEASLPAGVYVTGSPYRGVGMPDCVHQSQQTAQAVIAALGQRAIEQP